MRNIVVVAIPNSIHTARLCASISRASWNVHLFPCHDAAPHPDLKDLTLFDPTDTMRGLAPTSVDRRTVMPWSRLGTRPRVRAAGLAAVLSRLKPVLVHAHELQHGGLLVAAARGFLPRFPPVISSIWGSDMSLRHRLPDDRPGVVKVLEQTDVLTAECERDLRTARALGFVGETVLAMPNAGGFDRNQLARLRMPGPTSGRRAIAVKGYQSWAGRAEVALRAIERSADALKGYRISVYLATAHTAMLAQRLGAETSLDIQVVSRAGINLPHEEILALHGRSRISLGLSLADGVSTSFLEAIAMGSFPIQSGTACVDEWITHGEGGFIVPDEDPVAVEAALRTALRDDRLVDHAAEVNAAVVQSRLDAEYLSGQLMILYDRVARGEIARVESKVPGAAPGHAARRND